MKMFKQCSKCGEVKELSEFNKKKDGKFGVQTMCRMCRRDYRKRNYNKEKNASQCRNYRLNNIDKFKSYDKLYYINNKSLCNKRSKEYYESNKDRLKLMQKNNRSHINASRKQRYINDTGYRIECNIRSRIFGSLNGLNKFTSTRELIGCTIDELKTHLQSTAIVNGYKDFDINSYLGQDYHIDHVRPCSSFNLEDEEEQQKCFHYTNLQILSAEENLKKSNK